jgi:hypothetical protein
VWIIGAPFLAIIFSSMMFGPHSSMGSAGSRDERVRQGPGSAAINARSTQDSLL